MNNLIIIDDTICKQELDQFVNKNSDHIKLLLTEEEYDVDLDTLIDRIHYVFDNQKIIFIKTKNSVVKITSTEIFYVQEIEESLNLYLNNGLTYSLPDQLAHYTKMLSRFNILQINKHTLINAESIESFIIDEGILFCTNGKKFKVDEEYKQNLITELNKIYT